MMDSSQFTLNTKHFESLEPIETQSASCDTYRVKLYGKLHFLKRLKLALAIDIRYREALRKEFETGYRLEHPHLVRYVSMDDNSILMEYVDGETLTQCLASRPEFFKNRSNTDKLLRQLLDVISYLHSHQVLHLDLKPDNILLTRINNDVKLIDLGCCYTDTFTDTQGHTRTYAAPEQLNGGTADERTDIYAIGKLLEQLPNRYIYNKVIGRCTENDPAKRYQSINELRAAVFRRSAFLRPLLIIAVLSVIAVIVFILVEGGGWKVKGEYPVADTSSSTPTHVLPPVTTKEGTQTESGTIVKPVNVAPEVKKELQQSKDIEQLRADIRQIVLPAFNSTLGQVKDPSSNEESWNKQYSLFAEGEQRRLELLIGQHPEFPVDTILAEYRDYSLSLIRQAVNQ